MVHRQILKVIFQFVWQLFERSHTKTSSTFRNLCVIIFVMGASIHLVGDSINHRLVNLGYKLHLSVRDNPMMQSLQPRGLVCFVLLYDWFIVLIYLNIIDRKPVQSVLLSPGRVDCLLWACAVFEKKSCILIWITCTIYLICILFTLKMVFFLR